MKQDLQEELMIPEKITILLDEGLFTVKGPKGEVKRKFHNPRIVSKIADNKVVFESAKATKREKKLSLSSQTKRLPPPFDDWPNPSCRL